MRVGLVIYGSLDTISGGYLYDRVLVQHLRLCGDQVEVISLPWRNYARHLGDNCSRSLYQRLSQACLDVLLQDELNHPSLFWLNRRLKQRVHYPVVAIVHHLRCSESRPAWQNRLYRWVERRYLATLDSLIVNSQATRAAVEGLVGAGRKSIVAYPGGDRLHPSLTPTQIARRARRGGPLRILFIGNLIPRKGLHILLEGLSRLPEDSWQLEVIGSLAVDRAYVRAIHRQVRRAGLAERVVLPGPLSDSDLAGRLAGGDLLAVPSSYEGFGIVYLEAMGFGLPVIASTAGATQEIITHGRDGFLVPPDDVLSLARHVRELCQDRERLLQMGLAARQRYLAHPTWADSSQRIRRFLQILVK